MTNPVEQAHQALVRRLEQIHPSNGYQTDAGARVYEGWLQDVLAQEDVAFPLIAVQPAPYVPEPAKPGAQVWRIGRRVVGAVDPGTLLGYREALDALFLDLATALQVTEGQANPWGRPGPYKVTLEPGQLFPPGDGLAAGTLLFPVQLHIIIHTGD